MTKLRHYDQSGTARFVTFSTYRRLRAKYGIKIHGYVLMPDHVHLVLHPPDGQELGRLVGQVKSLSARRYFAEQNSLPNTETRILWQRRSYDHNCRDTDSVIEKINYCHNNPVMRGLVTEPGKWRWSSFNWYQGRVDVPLEIDTVEL